MGRYVVNCESWTTEIVGLLRVLKLFSLADPRIFPPKGRASQPGTLGSVMSLASTYKV